MVVATLAQSVGESPYGFYFPRGLRDRGYRAEAYATAATGQKRMPASPADSTKAV
ncbi:MAG: hypothetical protein ACYC6N_24255 [Pirellulaceae bacterium]